MFIKLYLREVYNLIQKKEDKKQKTTFRIRYRYYEYLVILSEFTNIPIIYKISINKLIRLYLDKTIIVYINNILIVFKEEKDYVKYVQYVIEELL